MGKKKEEKKGNSKGGDSFQYYPWEGGENQKARARLGKESPGGKKRGGVFYYGERGEKRVKRGNTVWCLPPALGTDGKGGPKNLHLRWCLEKKP